MKFCFETVFVKSSSMNIIIFGCTPGSVWYVIVDVY